MVEKTKHGARTKPVRVKVKIKKNLKQIINENKTCNKFSETCAEEEKISNLIHESLSNHKNDNKHISLNINRLYYLI